MSRTALTRSAVGAAIGAVLLPIGIRYIHPFPGDPAAYNHLIVMPAQGRLPRWAFDLCAFFESIGRPVVSLPTVLALAWLTARRLGRRSGLLLIAASGAALLTVVFKDVLGPTYPGAIPYTDGGATYPSGHVAYATAEFGVLAWLYWTNGRRDIALVAVVVIVGMGPFRVLQGAHFPSDVVGGYLLGFAWAAATVLVFGRTSARTRQSSP